MPPLQAVTASGLSHPWHRRAVGPVLSAGTAVVAVGLLQVVDPTQPGHLPTCPFLALTGWYCPGCGSLRMLHHLGEGDVVGAAAMNPVALLMVVGLVAGWTVWTRQVLVRRSRGASLPGWVVWASVMLVIGFGVARNLPAMGLLAPG